jgi:hypothetical protein
MHGYSREYRHPRFEREFFGTSDSITVIGEGSLGGKAGGLSLANEVLRTEFRDGRYRDVTVTVPHLTIITTDLFDEFLDLNDLRDIVTSGLPDDRIAHAFQQGELPSKLVGDLRALAQGVRVPIAVRSSSLLEDAMYRPFAGVYGTKMIPNNQPSPDERFRRLAEAVKYVYSSTYFRSAIDYLTAIGGEPGGEKMAVIIQEIVGSRSGDRFYPEVSGVARSFNFYPTGSAQPDEGVIELALGLGKTIVDGGRCWGYCPAYPKAPPPFNNLGDMLENTQKNFWAVNMGKPPAYDPLRETEYLVNCGLEKADYDDALRFVASTVRADTGRIVPGVGANGARLINFAPILDWEEIPLNTVIRDLLRKFCERLEVEVEIEFAVTIDRRKGLPARVGFLQVRPMVVAEEEVDVPEELLADDSVLVSSERVLGNGSYDDIRDIIFIPPDRFDTGRTQDLVPRLAAINSRLNREGRPYALIGFGRWGTSDRFCGIPVTWDQISGARVIVEVSLEGVPGDPSQGSHFFHNVTSLRVFYFTVPHSRVSEIKWDWLHAATVEGDGSDVMHVRLESPLTVRVDGRSRRGVVLIND